MYDNLKKGSRFLETDNTSSSLRRRAGVTVIHWSEIYTKSQCLSFGTCALNQPLVFKILFLSLHISISGMPQSCRVLFMSLNVAFSFHHGTLTCFTIPLTALRAPDTKR